MRLAIAAVLLAVASLSTCTPTGPDARGSTTAAPTPVRCPEGICQAGSDPVILVYDTHEDDLEPLQARLRWIDSEGCLVLDIEVARGGGTVVPMWPDGTAPLRAADGKRGVVIAGVGPLVDGETFSGRGVWQPDPKFMQPPARCRWHNGFVTISPNGFSVPRSS